MLEELFKLAKEGQLITYLFVALLYVVTGYILFKSGFAKKLIRSMGLVFYSDSSSFQSKRMTSHLFELEEKIQGIQKRLANKNLEAQRSAIEAELEDQLTRDIPKIVSRKLEKIKTLDNAFDSELKATIEEAVSAFLLANEPLKLLEDRREQLRLKERAERGNILEKTIQEQSQSAGRLKAVMINLFVIFNIGVLLIYLFAAASLTDRAVTAIIGLYVSLAAFIVYIYRTSNFRSSVLLALREDAKKYFDADDYIRRLKPGASPNDRDIEVLKLLLLNRAEREKMANHPYELILKGITNSNIQLKGGKMISSKKPAKNDTESA
ncbi:hypothetical protein ACXR0M_19590 [Pseudomonas sp. Eth.TT006]